MSLPSQKWISQLKLLLFFRVWNTNNAIKFYFVETKRYTAQSTDIYGLGKKKPRPNFWIVQNSATMKQIQQLFSAVFLNSKKKRHLRIG